MKAIYKYTLDTNIINRVQQVNMPHNASVIKADFQGTQLVIWAIVNPEDKGVEARSCAICFTGPIAYEKHDGMRQLIQPNNHVETLQAPSGIVAHVFVQK